jgi:hypothetical protein
MEELRGERVGEYRGSVLTGKATGRERLRGRRLCGRFGQANDDGRSPYLPCLSNRRRASSETPGGMSQAGYILENFSTMYTERFGLALYGVESNLRTRANPHEHWSERTFFLTRLCGL